MNVNDKSFVWIQDDSHIMASFAKQIRLFLSFSFLSGCRKHIFCSKSLVSSHTSHTSWVLVLWDFECRPVGILLFSPTLSPLLRGAWCYSMVVDKRGTKKVGPVLGSRPGRHTMKQYDLSMVPSLFQQSWLTSSLHWVLSRKRSCKTSLRV